MKVFIRVMKALSDPSRVRIIKMLGRQELCVCEFTSLLDLAQSTVSKHLRILEEAGLVDYRKQGSWIIYRLSSGEESDYARVMQENIRDWLDDDPQLKKMLFQLPQIARDRICVA